MSQTRPNTIEITWTVSMDQANMMLSILADRKFSEVADLIVELRNQAQAQLQLAQQQTMQSGGTMPSQRMDGEARVQ